MARVFTKKAFLVASVFLVMICVCAVLAYAAYNATKIGDKGLYPPPDGDRHNSYSWCMGILHHADGDYLYVGSNRDVAYLVMALFFRALDPAADFATVKSRIESFFGADIGTYESAGDVDLKPRIFRLKLDGTSDWELYYTAPTVSVQGQQVPLELGYRGMQIFTDSTGETALYVVTDSGIARTSRVLKISEDSSQPIKEVFRVTSATTSLRPIAIHEGRLYIGANNDVYEATNPEATADWTKIATDADFGGVIASGKRAMLWQFTSFNGYLYATMMEDVDPVGEQIEGNGGAWLFKGRYDADQSKWVWTPIVADRTLFPDAPYPKGMGNRFNSTFSLASFKNNLYVGTLMTFPSLIATGNLGLVLQNRIPPQIYRFDINDVGTMVIGDTVGTTKSTIFNSRTGNYGAGFFNPNFLQLLTPDPSIRDANFSLNQYLWWMAEYKGKLYASTFDLRVFLKYMTRDNLEDLGMIEPGDDAAWQNVQSMLDGLNTFNDNPAGFDLYVTSDGNNWSPVTRDGFGDQFNYGGRILLSTDDLLYIGTANPFYGAQVFTLDDTGSGGGGGGGGGCFIATAAFGSPLSGQVMVLREFRDRFLLTNALGSAFVSWYYENSPAASGWIAQHPVARLMVRIALYPVIGIAWAVNHTPYVLLIFMLIGAGLLVYRRMPLSRAKIK
ncbi:MAG TPA: hypothetical protein P5294_11075 [Smithellaceae bacterium]|nr:hypothetical protein [Smithellaceae bacterium]HRS90240.1 hypothetical protein [Smithellaceae bacterium]HRV27071.1 hypothetical protein [Smithellaceae bacterium]